jgi:hypothetical protein
LLLSRAARLTQRVVRILSKSLQFPNVTVQTRSKR